MSWNWGGCLSDVLLPGSREPAPATLPKLSRCPTRTRTRVLSLRCSGSVSVELAASDSDLNPLCSWERYEPFVPSFPPTTFTSLSAVLVASDPDLNPLWERYEPFLPSSPPTTITSFKVRCFSHALRKASDVLTISILLSLKDVSLLARWTNHTTASKMMASFFSSLSPSSI